MSIKRFVSRRDCHRGPIEVIENLFCGSGDESIAMVSKRICAYTLVPLHQLDPAVWQLGFRGEVLYYPIDDFGVLPDDVLADLTDKIISRLNSGKKVGLFCNGGHGRTGYVAAALLGKLGKVAPNVKTRFSKFASDGVGI